MIGKGSKFCTRRCVAEPGSTCGIRAHVKKAELKVEHIYFWDTDKNQGHLDPMMDVRAPHANAIWDMRWDNLTRIQFKELIEAV